MTIDEIWQAIDNGNIVFCGNESYQIIPVASFYTEYSKLSYRKDSALRVTCMNNYFGSFIDKTDLSQCFTKKEV